MSELDFIQNKLSNHVAEPVDTKFRYAILIPLIEVKGELHILYERRAKTLRNQPSEVSFPGGKIEEGETPMEAAIRETTEELLVDRDSISILGESDFLVNSYRGIIYSYVGVINLDIESIVPNESEVDYIFTVPLKFFLETKADEYLMDIKMERSEDFPYHLIPNGENYKFNRGTEIILFYNYNGEIIWGFTAKMTKSFANIIGGSIF